MRLNHILVAILDDTLDSEKESLDPVGLVLPERELPVQFNFQEGPVALLGYAKVKREGVRLYADLDIFENKLTGPAGKMVIDALTPALGGAIKSRESREGGTRLGGIEVRRIGIHVHRNADRRIQTIGEQVATQELTSKVSQAMDDALKKQTFESKKEAPADFKYAGPSTPRLPDIDLDARAKVAHERFERGMKALAAAAAIWRHGEGRLDRTAWLARILMRAADAADHVAGAAGAADAAIHAVQASAGPVETKSETKSEGKAEVQGWHKLSCSIDCSHPDHRVR